MVSGDTDLALARQAQKGDKEAFLKLYDRYFQKVFNRVKSKVPASYAEDVTQEVFIAVIRSLGRFEERSRFSTWLYTIVNRQIADFYRKRNRQLEGQAVSLDKVEHLLFDQADANPFNTERALIQKAILELPEHYQEIILARFALGLTFAEIAVARNQSLEAAKSLYRRAIQALRDNMGVST